jgi:hypothetical protein
MVDKANLPRQDSVISETGKPSREWYNFFRRLLTQVNELQDNPPSSGSDAPPFLSSGCVETTVQDATTARTLTADDDKVNVEFTNASAITVTVNANVMPENSITYLTQGAAGQVTVVAGSGVTIDYSDTLKTRTQESMIGLKQIQLNKFELFGDAEPLALARSALIRAANSNGAPAWVAPTADSQKLKRVSGALAWATDTASEIVNVASGNIVATNVQAAINELDSEKQPLDTQLTTIAGLTMTGNGGKALLVNTGGTDFELGTVATDLTNISTNVKLTTIGNGLYIAEGTNATMGVATLVAGTKVVSTTKVTANSRIFTSIQSLGTVTVPKGIGVTARSVGTSFTITSADATDTSVIAWYMIEPIIGGTVVTWNASDKGADLTLSGSNLIATRDGTNNNSWRTVRANTSRSSGKYYFEVDNTTNGSGNGYMSCGLCNATQSLTAQIGSSTNGYGLQANNTGGASSYYNAAQTSPFGASFITGGQNMMVAVDFDAGKIWWGINGTWAGDPAAGTGNTFSFTAGTTLFPGASLYGTTQVITGCFKTADFAHSVPSGFAAWE